MSAPASPSSASTVPSWFSSLLSASDHVVRGRVREVTAHARGPQGEPGIFTRVVLGEVSTGEGGNAERIDFWVEGGVLKDRVRRLSAGARFRENETVVVFLREAAGTRRLVHLGLGKWSAAGAGRFAPSAQALAHLAVGESALASPMAWEELVKAPAGRKPAR